MARLLRRSAAARTDRLPRSPTTATSRASALQHRYLARAVAAVSARTVFRQSTPVSWRKLRPAPARRSANPASGKPDRSTASTGATQQANVRLSLGLASAGRIRDLERGRRWRPTSPPRKRAAALESALVAEVANAWPTSGGGSRVARTGPQRTFETPAEILSAHPSRASPEPASSAL